MQLKVRDFHFQRSVQFSVAGWLVIQNIYALCKCGDCTATNTSGVAMNIFSEGAKGEFLRRKFLSNVQSNLRGG